MKLHGGDRAEVKVFWGSEQKEATLCRGEKEKCLVDFNCPQTKHLSTCWKIKPLENALLSSHVPFYLLPAVSMTWIKICLSRNIKKQYWYGPKPNYRISPPHQALSEASTITWQQTLPRSYFLCSSPAARLPLPGCDWPKSTFICSRDVTDGSGYCCLHGLSDEQRTVSVTELGTEHRGHTEHLRSHRNPELVRHHSSCPG